MVASPKEDAEIPAQFQALRLDDAPRQVKLYGAFVTKITKSHVFFVCMHIGYSFRRKTVQFPEGMQPGWWIGFERTDGKGVNDDIKSITNVRRAMPLFEVIFDPKHPKEISLHAKFVKRDMSAYPHLAKRVQDEFQKTIPAELYCEEIGEFTDPYGLADDCKESVLYDCVIILKMNRDEWDPDQTTVPNMTKTLLGVGKRCPKEEQPKVINTPWCREVLSIDCIAEGNEIKTDPRVGLIYEEKRIPSLAVRLLFVWNREVGSIQLKLEKQYETHPVSMLGKFIRFKTTTIAADEDKGYRMKAALFCGEVQREKCPRIYCKIVSVEAHHMESCVLAEVRVKCPMNMTGNQNLRAYTDFFGELDINTVDLARKCREQQLDISKLTGKQIPIYLKLAGGVHWEFHSIDPHKIELAIEQ